MPHPRRPARPAALAAVALLLLVAACASPAADHAGAGFRPIFDGATMAGWEGRLDRFRVEQGAIVGGSTERPMPNNEFLCTHRSYDDFVVRLEFRLVGDRTNAGVQIRSRRIPGDHEVIGYQADLGNGWWGALYDESRRRRVLARPDSAALARALDPDGWNRYEIRAEGPRIRSWINDVPMVDYTEPDPAIEQAGHLCLQIHSGPPGEAWYRGLEVEEM